jgi:hypothetical protein
MTEKFDFNEALRAIPSGQAISGKDGVLAPLLKQQCPPSGPGAETMLSIFSGMNSGGRSPNSAVPVFMNSPGAGGERKIRHRRVADRDWIGRREEAILGESAGIRQILNARGSGDAASPFLYLVKQ